MGVRFHTLSYTYQSKEPLSPLIYSDSDVEDAESQLGDRDALHTDNNKQLLPRIGTPILPSVLKSIPKKTARRATPDVSSRRRLRHDDSQIQFALVESSPLSADVDSQMLTDRQKEIRERQRHGSASLFPDIRSGPSRVKPTFTKGESPQLVLSTDRRSQEKLDADAETSPTFPPPRDMMTDFLGSSPTPRSSRKSSADRVGFNSPPSSPLSKGFPLPINSLPEYVPDQTEGRHPHSNVSVDGHLMSDVDVYVDKPSNPVLSSPAKINNDQEKSTVTPRDASTDLSGSCSLSDKETRIEMVKSEPIRDASNASQLYTGGVNCIRNSCNEGTICRSPNHDDEISAQLAHDLERASSQHGQAAGPVIESSEVGTIQVDTMHSKRKWSSASPEGIAKRVKRSPRRSIAVIIESRPRASVYSFPEDIASKPVSNIKDDLASRGTGSSRERSKSLEDLDCSSTHKNYGNRKQSVHKRGSGSFSQPSSQKRRSARLSQTSNRALEEDTSMATCLAQKGHQNHKSPSMPLGEPSTPSRKLSVHEGMTQVGDPSADTSPLPTTAKTPSVETLDVPEAPAVTSAQQLLQSPDSKDMTTNTSVCDVQHGDTGSGPDILQRLKLCLEDMRRVRLGVEEERAIVSVLFDSVREVHEAGRRKVTL